MQYHIIIEGKTPEELLIPIMNYWLYEHGQFTYSLSSKIFKIEKHLISKLLSNSYCLLKFGSCLLCQLNIQQKVADREEFIQALSNKKLICDYCHSYSANIESGILLPDFLEKTIQNLNEEELRILKGIVNLKTKYNIYRHIFNNDLEDLQTWSIINVLQKKKLISIERDSFWKIKSFKFDPEISNYL